MKYGVNRRPRTEYIITRRCVSCVSRTEEWKAYSLPVAGNVLSFGSEDSTSSNANSLGKSALSKAAALDG